ncbi:MAG: lipopolysaccharide transport periplasmic protein LptA [Pseudomonadota bacterium]|jgi:lipopolysaccharide export system protein LptA
MFPTSRPLPALLALALLGSGLSAPVLAERADRDKPINLEAARVTVDDAKKLQILEGKVVLTQGTLMITAERIVISEDQYGFQRGTAFAGPGQLARFRQKREGRDDYVEGESERIEYSSRNEVAELFQRARVRNGSDEIRGDYIWYDAIAEKFMVNGGDNKDTRSENTRVRASIQPKHQPLPPEAEPRPAALQLRSSTLLQRDSER